MKNFNGYIEDTLVLDKDTLIMKDSVTGDILDKTSVISMLQDSTGDSLPKAIVVEIEATHSGITKNFTEYMPKKMKASASTWTNPYEKPVLREHNPYAPALGRVKAHKFGKSILNPEKDTITLTLEITDKDSIRRHLDGTALTYSIGGQASELFCSICGIDIINSDTYCGHWKGRKYEKKVDGTDKVAKETCIWQIGQMEYLEVSEVNIPADVWAQKLSVKVKPETEEPDDDEDEEEDSAKTNTSDSTESNTIAAIVDSIIEDATTDPEDEETTGEAEEATTEENVTTEETTSKDTTSESSDVTDKAEQLIAKLADIVALTDKVSALEASITEKDQEITSLKEQLATATSEVASVTEKAKNTFSLNVELAKSIKRVYAESIVNAKISLGELEECTSTEEINSLVVKSATELSDILVGLRDAEKTRRTLPNVTLADVGNDGGALKVHQENADSDSNKSTQRSEVFTAKDAVEEILNLNN